MKNIFLWMLLLLGISYDSKAQDDDDYYKPPTKRVDVQNNAYPNLNRKSMSLYVGLEGGFKLNYAALSGTLGNTISSQNSNAFFWGINLGYNSDNRWAIETGYLKNPVAYVQTIERSRGPSAYRIEAALHTIPLRFKYKVWTLDAITKTASLYVGAGALIGTNANDKLIFNRKFTGSISSSGVRNSIELTTDSYLTKKGRVSFELQTELQGRIANGFYINLFGRMVAAPQGVVRSDIAFFQNSIKLDGATQFLKGISYNFGLSLRFDLAKGYKYKSKVE